jgi:hypothetical protein
LAGYAEVIKLPNGARRPSLGSVDRALSKGQPLLAEGLLVGLRAEIIQRRVTTTSVVELHTPIPPTKQPTPRGIAPRIGVGCQSFTLPSSANYDCYEGGNGVTLRQIFPLYYRSRQSQIAIAWALS